MECINKAAFLNLSKLNAAFNATIAIATEFQQKTLTDSVYYYLTEQNLTKGERNETKYLFIRCNDYFYCSKLCNS